MPVIDPSGFHIAAQIATSRGVFPLRMGGAEVDGRSIFTGETAGDFLDLPIVQSVNIELNFGMGGTISCEIHAPFELGRALLNSELFRIGNLLQVQLGYPKVGLFLPWFSGMTTKPNFRISGDEGLTATITAQGAAFTAQRNSGRVIYENQSYVDIITDIAERPYNNWIVDFPDQQRRGPSSDREDPLYRTRSSVSQGNRPDWPFLYNLCRLASAEAVLVYSHEDETRPTLRVRRRSDMFSGEPIYSFVLREQIDFINRFPMWDFETSGEGIWMPRSNAPISFGDWNPDTQEDTSVAVVEQQETAPQRPQQPQQLRARRNVLSFQRLREETLGVGAIEEVYDTGTTVAGLPGEGQHVTVSARDPSRTAEEVATQEGGEGSMRGGINCSFSSFGLPFVFPGDLVQVGGIGQFFDGNYLIEGLSHQASPGEWHMGVKALTNAPGGSGAIAEALRQEWTDPNRQEPPERAEPGSGPTQGRGIDGSE